jgi:hypothetical protein
MRLLMLQLYLPPTTSNAEAVINAATALDIVADADTTAAAGGAAYINPSMKQ